MKKIISTTIIFLSTFFVHNKSEATVSTHSLNTDRTKKVELMQQGEIKFVAKPQSIRSAIESITGLDLKGDLDLKVHDESGEIIVSNRDRLILHTDISELHDVIINLGVVQ